MAHFIQTPEGWQRNDTIFDVMFPSPEIAFHAPGIPTPQFIEVVSQGGLPDHTIPTMDVAEWGHA